MFSFIQDAGNYQSRRIKRSRADKYIISTCYTSDEGYETAVLDANGIHPVERYSSDTLAKIGHNAWCKKIASLTHINKLGGFGGLVENEVIELMGFDEEELISDAEKFGHDQ